MRNCLIMAMAFIAHLTGWSQTYQTNGAAQFVNDQCIDFTATASFTGGTFWTFEQYDFSHGLDLIFRFNFLCMDGADGLAFALQRTGSYAGNYSGSLGVEGLAPSVIVELDISSEAAYGDPSYDHLAVFFNGELDHRHGQDLIAAVPVNDDLTALDKCDDHWLRVRYDPRGHRMQIQIDCETRLDFVVPMEVREAVGHFHWGCTVGLGTSPASVEICPEYTATLPDTTQLLWSCDDEPLVLATQLRGQTFEWGPDRVPGGPTREVGTLEDTLYQVWVTDSCGLQQSEVFRIQPIAEVQLDVDTLLCPGEHVEIDLSHAPFAEQIRWSDGQSGATAIFTSAGAFYPMRLDGGCLRTDTAFVQTPEGLSRLLGPDRILCKGQSLVLGHPSLERFDPVWRDGLRGPVRPVDQPGAYGFTLSHRCGQSSEEVFVDQVACDGIFVPNAFSPNGDGVNDRLKPYGTAAARLRRFVIYDRWGGVVFQVSGLDLVAFDGWDGRHEASILPPQVFAFLAEVELGDQVVQQTGTFVLMR